MKRLTLSMACVLILIGMGPIASSAMADDDPKISVSVAFGRGLNTAQPGNPVNDAILPDKIKVQDDGVVHFLVAGFHQPVVYKPGTNPTDIAVPVSGTFINDPNNRFYQGINPVGGPLMTPGTINPSNAPNRVESVSFAEPGTYLVICNVRAHFLNGMFAFVEVKKAEKDD
jgi:hypothetical protein